MQYIQQHTVAGRYCTALLHAWGLHGWCRVWLPSVACRPPTPRQRQMTVPHPVWGAPAPCRPQVEAFRGSAAYGAFMRRWNLPVYFSLRFQVG